MKKMFYSKFTKTIAWLLLLALTFAFVYELYTGVVEYISDSEYSVYDFKNDFESSSAVSGLLNTPLQLLASAYREADIGSVHIHQHNGQILYMESTPAPTLAPPPTAVTPVPTAMPRTQIVTEPNPTVEPVPVPPTPSPTPSEAEAADMNVYEYAHEYFSTIENSEGLEYYVRINDAAFTNCDAKSEKDLMDRRFYYLATRSSVGDYNYESSGYRGSLRYLQSYFGASDIYGSDSIVVCSAINDDYAQQLEEIWQGQEAVVRECYHKLLVLLGGIVLLIIYLIAAAGKNSAGEIERSTMDKVWTEIYLALMLGCSIGAVVMCAGLIESSVSTFYGATPKYISEPLIFITAILGMLITVSSLLMLVRKLKQGRFINDSICCVFVAFAWRIAKALILWLFRTLRTLWSFFARTWKGFTTEIRSIMAKKTGRWLIGGLTIFSFLLWICGTFTPDAPIFLLFAIVIFAAAVYTLIKRAKDMDEIRKGTKEIKGGKLSCKIATPHSEDLKELADDINHIAKGLDESVAAKLKAEKLKTELITNVSHDLKTPLTSIISYTELLSKVEGLPEEAGDYVAIIAGKSDKLKRLTQDLFDISKVQSGNESINFERLDAALLIEQSLAEYEKEIKSSGLDFVVNLEKDVYINADGKKMSRAIGNLIGNILKYSLSGTRVFISLRATDGKARMEFKNIASYYMDFDAEEIVGRFVRGDESRSTEGSGLGLAIAKSYVEACKGSFELSIDGDLFKIIISFGQA